MTWTDCRRDRRRHLGVDGYRSLRTRKICLHLRARVRTRPAATLAETQTVAACRGVAAEMQERIDGLDFDIRAPGLADARRAAAAYAQWGKGVHPAPEPAPFGLAARSLT